MALFWHLVIFISVFSHFVCSDSSESQQSKSGERDDSSGPHQLAYESNSYPSQSMHSTNGYNSNQNQMSLSESNSAQVYGTGHQTNDQYDQKERKTLILAIPVKLKLPNKSEQDNYDQSGPQSEGEASQIQSQSLLYSKSLPYQSSYSLSRQPSYLSSESEDSDQKPPNSGILPPLSQKIYSSIESQLKSASYSTVNTQKSVSEQPSVPSIQSSNDHKYKNSYETKDQKLNPNHYVTDEDYARQYPVTGEYKGLTVKGESVDKDGYSIVNSRPMARPNSGKSAQPFGSYEDSYEARLKQKENAKQMYESIPNNKPEYDYDSDTDEDEEEVDDRKVENIYYSHKDYQNNKNGFNSNPKKSPFQSQPVAPKQNVGPQSHHNHKGLGQSLAVYSADFESWPQYYYSKPNLNYNDWSGIPETVPTVDTSNLLNLNLFKGFSINNPVKNNIRNPMYAQAFDLLSDGQLKAASNPVPIKTLHNSKIYGQAAKYQSGHPSLNLFGGQPVSLRDYSLIDLSGDLYPAPIVGQTPPRKQQRPLKQESLNIEYNSGNRDLIKPHRRNPLLLRPSFMSGLRSAATKPLAPLAQLAPLANYSPFASASTTQSFLSVLPSLPSLQTSFNINAKSIPRQIFPLLYG